MIRDSVISEAGLRDERLTDAPLTDAPLTDDRLGEALALLQKPPRHRMPGIVPLLAGCAFIGAATLLAYVYTKTPMISASAGKTVAATPASQQVPPANKADFELSAAAQPPAATNEIVTDAVPLGTVPGSVSAGSEAAR